MKMRKSILGPGLLAAGVALSAIVLPACVVEPPPGTVYASFAPPRAEVEVIGTAPGPDYVWIGGHHVWHNNAYSWEAGRWARPPRAGVRWHSGEWVHHSKGWYWRDGAWR